LTVAENRELADALTRLERHEEAAAAYEDALDLEPDDVPCLLGRGEALLAAEKAAAAVSSLEKVSRQEPNHERVDELLGRAYAGSGRLGEAVEAIERALQRSPTVPLFELLAECWRKQGREDERARALDRLSLLRRDDPETLLELGRAHAASGRRDEAIAALERAWELSGAAGAAELLARLLLEAALHAVEHRAAERALGLLERAVRVAEPFDDLLMEIIRSYERLSETELAARTAEVVARRSPARLDALLALGNARAAQGRDEEALAWFERASAAKLDSVEALLGAGRLLVRAGRVTEARDGLLRALRFAPAHDEAARLLLASRSNTDAPEQLREILDEVVTLRPNDAAAKAELARVELALGHAARAEQLLAEALATGTQRADWFVYSAQALAALGRSEQSAQMAARALELEPEQKDALRLLGVAQAARGETAAAIEALERALAGGAPTPHAAERLHRLHREHAANLEANGDIAGAGRSHARALELVPEDHEARLGLARCLLEMSDVQRAVDVLETGVSERAEHLDLWVLLGSTFLEKGMNDRALRALETAARLAPDSVEITEKLAVAQARTGRDREAIGRLRALAEANRGTPAGLRMLARLYEKHGDFAAVVHCFEHLSNRASLDADERRQLGLALAASGRGREALEVLESVVALEPAPAGVLRRLAQLRLEAGNPAGAAQAFETAVEASPDDVVAWLGLANARAREGNLESTVRAAARVLEREPQNVIALRLRGGALLRLGRHAEAEPLLGAAASLDPSADLFRDLAACYARLGDVKKRLQALEALVGLAPNDAAAHFEHGMARRQAGHALAAVDAFRNALRLDPALEAAQKALTETALHEARQLLASDKLEPALAVLSPAVETVPQDQELVLMHGSVLTRLGRPDAAAERYRVALSRDPDAPELLARLGVIYYSQEQKAESVPLLRRALAAKPDHVQAALLLGRALVELGRLDEAVGVLERIASLAPGHAAYVALGEALERGRDFRRAAEAYQKALGAQPNDLETHRRLATSLAMTGLIEPAIRTLERATHLAPADPRIRFALGRLYLTASRFQEARGQWEALRTLDPKMADELGRAMNAS
jgi:tetratricopeptide (TPR) repeat protein